MTPDRALGPFPDEIEHDVARVAAIPTKPKPIEFDGIRPEETMITVRFHDGPLDGEERSFYIRTAPERLDARLTLRDSLNQISFVEEFVYLLDREESGVAWYIGWTPEEALRVIGVEGE